MSTPSLASSTKNDPRAQQNSDLRNIKPAQTVTPSFHANHASPTLPTRPLGDKPENTVRSPNFASKASPLQNFVRTPPISHGLPSRTSNRISPPPPGFYAKRKISSAKPLTTLKRIARTLPVVSSPSPKRQSPTLSHTQEKAVHSSSESHPRPKRQSPTLSPTHELAVDSSLESSDSLPKRPRQTFAVVIDKRPYSRSTSSLDLLARGAQNLKRKHKYSKESVLRDGSRPSQMQKRDSSEDTSTASTTSTDVVNPTDFSLVKDERDLVSLFEPKKKIPRTDSTLTIPAKPLRPSRLSPYQRALRLYEQKLSQIPSPSVTFANDEDEILPDGKFEFIDQYILFPGVEKAEDGFNTGCNCFPDGNVYGPCDISSCACAGQDEDEDGGAIPYERGLGGITVLTDAIMSKTVSIHECNIRCDCGPTCMNRVVQKGRTVRLEIFRAGGRGFGKAACHLIMFRNLTLYRPSVPRSGSERTVH